MFLILEKMLQYPADRQSNPVPVLCRLTTRAITSWPETILFLMQNEPIQPPGYVLVLTLESNPCQAIQAGYETGPPKWVLKFHPVGFCFAIAVFICFQYTRFENRASFDNFGSTFIFWMYSESTQNHSRCQMCMRFSPVWWERIRLPVLRSPIL